VLSRERRSDVDANASAVTTVDPKPGAEYRFGTWNELPRMLIRACRNTRRVRTELISMIVDDLRE